MKNRTRRLPGTLLGILLGLLLLSGLAACNPQLASPPPPPTFTPIPATQTSTPTIVWFPPTATYTPFPTLVITPTLDVQPLFGELIFSDNFTQPTTWTLGQTASTSMALGVEELTLAIDQPGGYLYSLRGGTDSRDFYLEITASPSLCKGQDEYGLLLRVSPNMDFYRFSLTCDGQIRLDKYFQGKASSPKAPEYSGAVPPGAPMKCVSLIGIVQNGMCSGPCDRQLVRRCRIHVRQGYGVCTATPALSRADRRHQGGCLDA